MLTLMNYNATHVFTFVNFASAYSIANK